MTMYNIYNELNCHIAYVSEEELEQLKEEGIIQDTDRIEKDEEGYSD